MKTKSTTTQDNLISIQNKTKTASNIKFIILIMFGIMIILSSIISYTTELENSGVTLKKNTVTAINKANEDGSWTIPSKINGITIKSIDISENSKCVANKIIIPSTVHDVKISNPNITEIVFPNNWHTIGTKNDLLKNYDWYASVSITNSVKSIVIPSEQFSVSDNILEGFYDLTLYFEAAEEFSLFMVYDCKKIWNYGGKHSKTDDGFSWALLKDGNIAITDYNGNDIELNIPSTIQGKTVTVIGANAFSKADSITSVTIPNSINSIGWCAFEKCNSLTSVYITDMTKWCNISFREQFANPLSKAHNLYLNNQLVTDLVIPEGITNIKNYTFEGCNSLTNVIIPNGITNIESYAFEKCNSLISVSIPDSVTSIKANAFKDCNSLTGVFITDIAKWCTIDFSDKEANPLSYANNLYLNNKLVETLIIPDNINKIKSYAFYNCHSLKSIVIPKSILDIGDNVFTKCSYLKIYCQSNKKPPFWELDWNDNKGSEVWGCQESGITDDYVWVEKDGKIIIIGYIGNEINIKIPDTINGKPVSSLGKCAFLTKSLISVIMPKSVKHIEFFAFSKSLKELFYNGNEDEWEKVDVDEYMAFKDTTIYYYTETKPTKSGNYWHYDTDKQTIIKW